MGIKQFNQSVTGQAGMPVQTAPNGTIQTDNYETATAFDKDGSSYNYSFNPSFTVQELVLTQSGDVDAEITTTSGDTFVLRTHGTTLTLDTVSIDSIVFKDPRGTSARLTGVIIGE
jgi:hypothetical protein